MTNPFSTRILSIGFLATFALGGCSGAPSSEEEEAQIDPQASPSLKPEQAVSDTSCTTTRDDSDANYICYTTTCKTTTTIECFPKPKKMRPWGTLSK